jgi:hypothetical protein
MLRRVFLLAVRAPVIPLKIYCYERSAPRPRSGFGEDRWHLRCAVQYLPRGTNAPRQSGARSVGRLRAADARAPVSVRVGVRFPCLSISSAVAPLQTAAANSACIALGQRRLLRTGRKGSYIPCSDSGASVRRSPDRHQQEFSGPPAPSDREQDRTRSGTGGIVHLRRDCHSRQSCTLCIQLEQGEAALGKTLLR